MSQAPTPPAKGWWFRNPKNLILPSIVALIGLGLALNALVRAVGQPDPEVTAQEAGQGAYMGVKEALADLQAPPPTTEVPQRPYYDFLTCEGWTEGTTCEPVFAYPLTPDAKQLIGFEPNTAGLINMERGRSVFVQWRGMHGVNECDVSIGLEARPVPAGQPPVADRKLYPTKVPGKAALLDCSGKAAVASGALPTVGQQ